LFRRSIDETLGVLLLLLLSPRGVEFTEVGSNDKDEIGARIAGGSIGRRFLVLGGRDGEDGVLTTASRAANDERRSMLIKSIQE
jgi:hypothetical protein